jgi:hypothetical protein
MHTTLNFRENVMQLLLSHSLPSSAALDLIEAADHGEPASYIVDGEQFEVIREHTGHVHPGFRYVIDSTVLVDRPEAPWYQNAPQTPVQAQEQAEANAALAADQGKRCRRTVSPAQTWSSPGLSTTLTCDHPARVSQAADIMSDMANTAAEYHRVNRGAY